MYLIPPETLPCFLLLSLDLCFQSIFSPTTKERWTCVDEDAGWVASSLIFRSDSFFLSFASRLLSFHVVFPLFARLTCIRCIFLCFSRVFYPLVCFLLWFNWPSSWIVSTLCVCVTEWRHSSSMMLWCWRMRCWKRETREFEEWLHGHPLSLLILCSWTQTTPTDSVVNIPSPDVSSLLSSWPLLTKGWKTESR